MKTRFRIFASLGALCVASLIAWAVSHWTDFPFWGAFAIVVVALAVNGFIAEREDNAPGGFNNPLPPAKPEKSRTSRNEKAKRREARLSAQRYTPPDEPHH